MSVNVDIIVLINVLRICDAYESFLRPGFLRSTLRESRVRSPARFNESRKSGVLLEEGHERIP